MPSLHFLCMQPWKKCLFAGPVFTTQSPTMYLGFRSNWTLCGWTESYCKNREWYRSCSMYVKNLNDDHFCSRCWIQFSRTHRQILISKYNTRYQYYIIHLKTDASRLLRPISLALFSNLTRVFFNETPFIARISFQIAKSKPSYHGENI